MSSSSNAQKPQLTVITRTGENSLSLNVGDQIDGTRSNITRLTQSSGPEVDMNQLMSILTDFSGLGQPQIQSVTPINPSIITQTCNSFPEIMPGLLESSVLPEQNNNSGNSESIQFSPEFQKIQSEYQEILSTSENDLELRLKKSSLLLHKVHYNYDLGIYTQEKKLEFLLELKYFLKHFKDEQQIETFKQKFFEHKYKSLIETEKKDLVVLARKLYAIYFTSKNKLEEIKEKQQQAEQEKQQQAEQERLRQEAEVKRIQDSAEQEIKSRVVNNLTNLEIELGVDNETWNKQQQEEERKAEEARKTEEAKKTEEIRRLEQLKGVEMARTHTEKFAKRRAERLSQLSSQPLSKSDEK